MPGEVQQFLTVANFARDNIVWSDVETTRGVYNWTHTDTLLAEYDSAGRLPGSEALTAHMLTLAYANKLYDDAKGSNTQLCYAISSCHGVVAPLPALLPAAQMHASIG